MDIHTFAGQTKNPSIDQLTVKLLQEYYDHYLYPNKYRYELDDKNVVELVFNKENLCHLLGIETIIQKAVPMNQHVNYKGMRGYDNITNGTITFETLKHMDKKRFKSGKDKFVFFFWLHKLVESPNLLLEYRSITSTQIVCDFMLYDTDAYVIAHLGVTKDRELYYPRSFLIERINHNNNGEKFITGLTKIKVVTSAKLPRTH